MAGTPVTQGIGLGDMEAKRKNIQVGQYRCDHTNQQQTCRDALRAQSQTYSKRDGGMGQYGGHG